MNEPRISRIPILPFNMVNAHLIQGAGGCVLVDAGLPGSEQRIAKALNKSGLSFKDISLIVITHAHVDHAGAAYTLRQLTRAPIVAHMADAKYFRNEVPMTFCPTGWAGRLFLKTPVPYERYKSFVPDIMLAENDILNLSRYGIPGIIRHTPGHTNGSISVELSSKDALVGDLVASGVLIGGLIRTRHAIRPPFEDNPHIVAQELQRLIDSGMERFYMGHGGPLAAKEVKRHIQTLRSIK